VTANSSGALGSTSTSGYSFSQMSSVIAEAHADGIPVSIVIDPASAFTTIDASASLTTTFASNLIAFCNKYNLDGIDFDWEPTSPSSTQISNYGNLIAAVHSQTSVDGLTLSVAVSASHQVIPVSAASNLNWVFVMDYDLEYYSSAPYSDSISYLTQWANYGIPKSKLVMGCPFYGTSGTGWDNSTAAQYGTLMSDYAAANNGSLPPTTADSITINGTTWGYNGVATMTEKAQYVLANGYGGMGIWELGQDDFASGQSGYNLLAAIKSTMAAAAPSWQVASGGAMFSSFALSGGGAGGLTIGSGTVTLSADAGSSISTFAVTTETGGTLSVNTTQHLATLTLNGGKASYAAAGSGVVETGALALRGSAAKLDLGAHDMIVHNGNLAQLTSEIATGFNAASGSLWSGNGITSSAAAATAGMALGIELNSSGGGALMSAFDGQSVVSTDVLIKYTQFGDADLNGAVNAADYALIDNGFNQKLTGWHNGDFNYDGAIDGDDYSLIDNSFDVQAETLAIAPTAEPMASVSPAIAGAQHALAAAPAKASMLPAAPPPRFETEPTVFADSPLDELLQAATGVGA